MCGAFSALLRARQLYWGWPHFSGLPVWGGHFARRRGRAGLVKSRHFLGGPQRRLSRTLRGPVPDGWAACYARRVFRSAVASLRTLVFGFRGWLIAPLRALEKLVLKRHFAMCGAFS